ncbi:MAG TPA: hypothetical protein VIM84_12135, partial [Gemmatimonadales bacterium]
ADPVRYGGQRRIERPEAGPDRIGVIDVCRSTSLLGDVRQRHSGHYEAALLSHEPGIDEELV